MLLFGFIKDSASAVHLERPNILMILADDQTWSDLGCYGNTDVKTPNLDRLAREGMLFKNAFTATAMCSPSRQQLLTGLFPVRNGAYPNHSQVKPGTKSIVHYLKELGYRVGLAGKKHIGPQKSFPFENVGGNRLNFRAIDNFVGRDKHQPYCLVVASHSPHLPWTAGNSAAYDPKKLTIHPYMVGTRETRRALAKYYAEVTDFDREVGRCLEIVKRSGSEENTLVITTSEQGAQFPRGKWTCYETGLHVAMIVRWPKVIEAGTKTGALVQYVDIVPTLLELVGEKKRKNLDGKSFFSVLTGSTKTHHDYVFGVQTTRGIISGSECYPIRSIRSKTHKLIWNLNYKSKFRNVLTSSRDRGGYWNSWVRKANTDERAARLVNGYQVRPELELYDLRTDPYELKNLSEAPAQKDLLKVLKTKLQTWMREQGDKGIETELAAKTRQKRNRKK